MMPWVPPCRSESVLDKIMAWCLTTPSHYLKQCLLNNLTVIENLWYSPESNFTEVTKDFNHWNMFENYTFKFAKSCQRVSIPELYSVSFFFSVVLLMAMTSSSSRVASSRNKLKMYLGAISVSNIFF